MGRVEEAFRERHEIALGMTLAHEHRQVGGHPGELRVTTKRRCAERPAGLVQHVSCSGFGGQPHAQGDRTRVGDRMPVDPLRGFTQQCAGRFKMQIDAPQRGELECAAPGRRRCQQLAVQRGTDRRCTAVPAGRNSRTPLPESGSRQYEPTLPTRRASAPLNDTSTLALPAMPTACQLEAFTVTDGCSIATATNCGPAPSRCHAVSRP